MSLTPRNANTDPILQDHALNWSTCGAVDAAEVWWFVARHPALSCDNRPDFAELPDAARELIVAVRGFARQYGKWPSRTSLQKLLFVDTSRLGEMVTEAGGDYVRRLDGEQVALTLKAALLAPDSELEVLCLEHFLEALRGASAAQGVLQPADLEGCPAGPIFHRFLLLTLCTGEAFLPGTHPQHPLFIGATWPWWPAILAHLPVPAVVLATSPVQPALLGIDGERLLDQLGEVQARLRAGIVDRRRCAWLASEAAMAVPHVKQAIGRAFGWVWTANSTPDLDHRAIAEVIEAVNVQVKARAVEPPAVLAKPFRIAVGEFELTIESPSGARRTLRFQEAQFGKAEPNRDWHLLRILAHRGFVEALLEDVTADAHKVRINRIAKRLQALCPGLAKPIHFNRGARVYAVDRERLDLRLARDHEQLAADENADAPDN